MTEEPRAITTPEIKKNPHVPGTRRATAALILSLLAMVCSVYVYLTSRDEHEGRVVSPLVMEKSAAADLTPLQNRIAAQEAALNTVNDALKKQADDLAQKIAADNAAPKTDKVNVDVLSGTTVALQQKLAELEKQNSDFQQNIKDDIAAKSKSLTGLAQLQGVAHRMQLGLTFQDEVKALEQNIPVTETALHAYNLLRGQEHALASDNALRDGLHALAPDFLAKEKMEHADGFFKKIVIQLEKLVVVRRKNGRMDEDTPATKVLEELENAMVTGDWAKATGIAASLTDKAPKDFPAWQQQLRERALAQEALANLQKEILDSLGATKLPEQKPVEIKPPVVQPVPPKPDSTKLGPQQEPRP